MGPAVGRGTIAAAMISEPFLSAARDDVRPFAKSFDAVAKQFLLNAWFARRDWLAANPDIARRLFAAAIDSARWANTHHAESAAVLAKIAKLDPTTITAMTRASYATSIEPRFMQPILDVAVKYKVLDRPLNAADLIVRPPA